jgi:hypothetical protein
MLILRVMRVCFVIDLSGQSNFSWLINCSIRIYKFLDFVMF